MKRKGKGEGKGKGSSLPHPFPFSLPSSLIWISLPKIKMWLDLSPPPGGRGEGVIYGTLQPS